MKRCNLLSLIICLLLILAVAGCNSSTDKGAANQDKTQNAQPVDSQKTEQTDSKKVEKPGSPSVSNAKPAEKTGNTSNGYQMASPDLFGQVKSINGSKITLALAKMPQRTQQSHQGQPPAQDDAAKAEQPFQGDPTKTPAAPSEKPAGPPPGAGTAPELTGETKIITVPDSAGIETGRRGNIQETTIDKIKAGDMLQVFYKEGKADEIERIRVMQTNQ